MNGNHMIADKQIVVNPQNDFYTSTDISKITVFNIRLAPWLGCLATVSVRAGPITIHNIRVMAGFRRRARVVAPRCVAVERPTWVAICDAILMTIVRYGDDYER